MGLRLSTLIGPLHSTFTTPPSPEPEMPTEFKSYPFAGYGGHHPKWWDPESRSIRLWQPYLEKVEVPLEELLGTYIFVAMHHEADDRYELDLASPGKFTLSMPGTGSTSAEATKPSWDQVEATYQRGPLSGTAKGFQRPQRSNDEERQKAIDDRCNLRRFDFITMDPPDWYSGKVNHALDVVVPVDENGNHYISVMLHYHDNPEFNVVSLLGKKVVGGQEVGLTDKERIQLGIGIRSEDIPRGEV